MTAKFRMILLGMLLLGIFSMLVAAQQYSETFTGRVDNDTPYVEFTFLVEQDGSQITLDIRPILGEAGGDLDTLLYLVYEDPLTGDRNIVAENDDRSRQDYSSYIEFPYANAGQYTAIATRYGVAEGSSGGEFNLTIEVMDASPTINVVYDVSDETLAAVGFPTPDTYPVREVAEWTILTYYGGDNNLEPSVMSDFKEFELAGGSDDNVNIVMLLDRHPEFTTAGGDWHDTRVFVIEADVTSDVGRVYPPTLDTPPLAVLDDMNTGDGETFAQFLVWGIRHFPAKRYAVAFASHGAAWKGIITDETSDHSIISLPELSAAFDIATQAAGVEKFDLLVNDACLMSSVEYFGAISDYFNLTIASPEIVIDPALDMTEFTHRLKADLGGVDLDALSKDLVDLYINRDVVTSGSADSAFFTSAVTDLTQFDSVVEAVENFAAILNTDMMLFKDTLGRARSNAYTYTSFAGNITKIDLQDFIMWFIAESLAEDAAAVEAAQDVLDALKDVRLHHNSGERAEGLGYYNIYFPGNSSYFDPKYLNESPLIEWAKMLRSYYNAVTPQIWAADTAAIPFHPPVAPQITITSRYPDVASVVEPLAMGVQVVGRNISHVDFTVDYVQEDGSVVRLSSERALEEGLVDDTVKRYPLPLHGVDVLQYTWDVTQPKVTDGVTSAFELLVVTEEVASLDGMYTEPGSDTARDVSIIFDTDGNALRAITQDEATGSTATVEIPVGSSFVAFRSIVTPDGRIVSEPGTVYTWPEGGLKWSWEPAPSGRYNLGLLATAFGGTTGFSSTSIDVENDPAFFDQRGDTRKDLGFTIVRPAEWDRLVLYQQPFYFRSNNSDATSNITVYMAFPGFTVEQATEDIAAFVAQAAGFYGLEIDEPFTPITVNGQDALEFTLRYETDQGVFNGRAFARYNAQRGIGEIFSSEALEGTGDIEGVYQNLRDRTTFFDPVALTDASIASWGFNPNVWGTTYKYPIPLAWMTDRYAEMGGVEVGIWWRYSPGGDTASPMFIATSQAEASGSAIEVLDGLVEEYVAATTESFQQFAVAIFNNDNGLRWNAVTFSAVRNGQAIIGRMYVTVVQGAAYAVWVETLDTQSVKPIFASVFEPVINGFLVELVEE